MNNDTILQIPISKSLRYQAQSQVIEAGFSSLQDYIRLHLTQLKNNVIHLTTKSKPIVLSNKAIKRYNIISKDIDRNKNLYKTKNINDLISQLNA